MTTEEIEQYTWNFLRNKGLSELSTAAVMGNIEAESSFDPTEVEAGNSIGFGLCQWSFERRTQLEAYGTDLDHQFNFLWSELTGQDLATTGASYQWINKSGYLTNDQFMSGNGSLNELTSAFCFCWERPNASLAHLDRRQTSANTFYNQFTGTVPTDPSGQIDPVLNPARPGDIKLKNNYLYGATDRFLGNKFTSPTGNKSFTLVGTMGDKAYILDGEIIRGVPKKNIIL